MAERVTTANNWQRYDWDEWLDGDTWQLTKGTDFECSVESMRQQAHGAATRRRKRVLTRKLDDNTLIIQAIPAR